MLQCQDITKKYSSGRGEMYALRGASFTVAPAAMVVIVGKSGSGKTTLLNCMGGLDQPTVAGLYGGRDLHKLSPQELSLFLRRDMGFVFQFGNMLSYLTVFENISFPLTLNTMSTREKNGSRGRAARSYRSG